jgi:hypothetical protein
MTWEEYELPPVEPEPLTDEVTPEEALDIILGGAT